MTYCRPCIDGMSYHFHGDSQGWSFLSSPSKLRRPIGIRNVLLRRWASIHHRATNRHHRTCSCQLELFHQDNEITFSSAVITGSASTVAIVAVLRVCSSHYQMRGFSSSIERLKVTQISLLAYKQAQMANRHPLDLHCCLLSRLMVCRDGA